MEESQRYETFLRSRITELRVRKDVSEHRMSLDLGKSGSYIRSITNGMSLPSLRELFNIISYFDLTPTEFFAGADAENSLRAQLHEEITRLSEEDLEKVSTVKAKLFCPEIAGLFCRIAGLFCHDSRANLSLKPVCFGIAIS